MCVVSMIMDHYYDKWRNPQPEPWRSPPPYKPTQPNTIPCIPVPMPAAPPKIPTQEEIDEFYRLLERARQYDRDNNEPDCELESKKQRLLDLAKELGIEISFA